jgi:hypothetical protein
VSTHVTKTIDHSLYPRNALADARQAFRDYCSLQIAPLSNDRAEVTITINDTYDSDGRQVVLDFLNYLLDRSAQIVFEQETE